MPITNSTEWARPEPPTPIICPDCFHHSEDGYIVKWSTADEYYMANRVVIECSTGSQRIECHDLTNMSRHSTKNETYNGMYHGPREAICPHCGHTTVVG